MLLEYVLKLFAFATSHLHAACLDPDMQGIERERVAAFHREPGTGFRFSLCIVFF